MELVKITYRFADGHVEEIEVEKEVAEMLEDQECKERSNNRRETRRHELLSSLEFEGELFVDLRSDTELAAIRTIETKKLWMAFSLLKPKQQKLLFALYLSARPVSQAEYAVRHGLREESVWQNAWRARNALKKLLEKL